MEIILKVLNIKDFFVEFFGIRTWYIILDVLYF